ncbi:retroviral-like aspartic protease family protein [Arenicella sp.]|nr:retroviral-like aspartic protease family protein [Arenicella sp.]
MSKNLTFIALITALGMAGAYGVYSILQQKPLTSKEDFLVQRITQEEKVTNSGIAQPAIKQELEPSADDEYQKAMAETVRYLENSQYGPAVELVDSLYRQLTTKQLENFETLFLNTATQLWQSNKSKSAIALLTIYNDTFNGLAGWTLLSNIHLTKQDYQAGIEALLKAMPLEYQPDKLSVLMTNLIGAASAQRALLEGQKDELGINQLYKRLHEQRPSNGRFQLELASSYLRLNNSIKARVLLETLQYDTEYGDIAKTVLARLEGNSVAAIEQPVNDLPSRNEIVVPLQRAGNSFFATTLINNREHRLLLDTGASITALSENTIKSLNLKPTGRTIQLNTANGITQARLYTAEQIKLGSLTIKNLLVAEIDFDKNSQIHGLLGTDLLNQLDSRYSYIIDNHRNALIFRSKNN